MEIRTTFKTLLKSTASSTSLLRLALSPLMFVALLQGCSSLSKDQIILRQKQSRQYETFWSSRFRTARCEVHREDFDAIKSMKSRQLGFIEYLNDFENGLMSTRYKSDAILGASDEKALRSVQFITSVYVSGPMNKMTLNQFKEEPEAYTMTQNGIQIRLDRSLQLYEIVFPDMERISFEYSKNKRNRLSFQKIKLVRGKTDSDVEVSYLDEFPYNINSVSFKDQNTSLRFKSCQYFK